MLKKGRTTAIERTFKAAASSRTSPCEKRLPLTVDILGSVKDRLDFSSPDDRALWAILCVGVFTLARLGELVPGSTSATKVPLRAAKITRRGGP